MRRLFAARLFGVPVVLVVAVAVLGFYLYRRRQQAAQAAAGGGTVGATGDPCDESSPAYDPAACQQAGGTPYSSAAQIDASGAGVDSGLVTSGGYPSMYPVPVPGPTGPQGPRGPAGPLAPCPPGYSRAKNGACLPPCPPGMGRDRYGRCVRPYRKRRTPARVGATSGGPATT